MKKLIFLCLFGAMILSCNDDINLLAPGEDLSTQTRVRPENNQKVNVCHYDAESGEYHTINISEKALQAHLDHGDYIGKCDNNDCDPSVNLFCDYLGYFDFDEPCDVYPPNGDAYCTREVYYGSGMDLGWLVEIWDNDAARNMYCEGSDEEDDSGLIYVTYLKSGPGGSWEYRVGANLYNNDTYSMVFPPYYEIVDEATAIAHAGFISDLAVENGLTDSCEGGPDF